MSVMEALGGARLTADEAEQAGCAQTGAGDVWYPEKGGTTHDAKVVCAACPVRQRCLEVALANDERFGVFGGLSPNERRKVARGEPVQFPPAWMERPEPTPVQKVGRKTLPREHGNLRGYNQHRRASESPCDACRTANSAYQAARRAARGVAPRSEIRHGTRSGYQRHRALNEDACRECSDANAAYLQEYRQRQAVAS